MDNIIHTKMDILKAFKLVNKDIEINIQGTCGELLFQANQIGKILELKCIVENIRDFNQDEKLLQAMQTRRGIQNVVFLTEIGLYKLLGRSKKPIAGIFQKWIINVIKEIRKKMVFIN